MKSGEGAPAVLGKSVSIHGELTGSEDLYMDGEILGTLKLTESRLTVGPNARVLADVAARDVIVYGHVEGNIHATGRVELRQTASVTGDIRTVRLSIEESAQVHGKIETGIAETKTASATTGYAPVAAEAEPAEQPSLYREAQ